MINKPKPITSRFTIERELLPGFTIGRLAQDLYSNSRN
jgi:hypothetical protein